MGEEKRLPDPAPEAGEALKAQPERRVLHWLNSAKGIGVILVILGHLLYNSRFVGFNHYIYAFHMPLFFIISGYLQRPEPKEPFLLRKALRLLPPFVCFSILGLPLFLPRLLGWRKSGEEIAAQILFLHGYMSNSPLWFLVVLFEVYCMFYLLHWALKHPAMQALVCAAAFVGGYFLSLRMQANVAAELPAAQDPWNTLGVNRAVVCLGFFLVGMLLQKLPLDEPRFWQLPLMALVLWGGVELGVMRNPKVSLYKMNLQNYPFFVLSAVFFTLGLMLFARLLLDRPWWLAYLSHCSVLFLGSQYFWIIPLNAAVSRHKLAKTPEYDLIMVGTTLLYLLVLPPLYDFLKKYVPFVKLLNGETI